MQTRITAAKVLVPGSTRVLFHVSRFEINPGQKILIRGPSGIGKTTFLHLLAGLIDPDEGIVAWDGADLKTKSEDERCLFRRRHIGFVFQRLNLIEHLSSTENIRLGLLEPRPEAEKKARAIIESLGLGLRADSQVGELSLGEQQRIAVARAIALGPALVLADEPTSSLDGDNTNSVVDLLFRIPSKPALVVVSHDVRLGNGFDRVYSFEELTTP